MPASKFKDICCRKNYFESQVTRLRMNNIHIFNDKKLKVLDEGMSFAKPRKHSKHQNKFKGEIEALSNEKLYMEVYQRRENYRFYGIAESQRGVDWLYIGT